LIGIVALAPMAVLCAVMWRETQQDLVRLRTENAGVEYARVVWRIAHAAAQKGAVDKVHGLQLEGAARHAPLRARSTALRAAVRNGASAPDTAHAAQDLLKSVGDHSGLLLDDAAGRHHHIRVVLLHLPELATAIAQSNALLGPEGLASTDSPGLAFARVKFALGHAMAAGRDALSATDDPVARAHLEAALARLDAQMADHDRTAREWLRERQRALTGGVEDPAFGNRLRALHTAMLDTAEAVNSTATMHLMRSFDSLERTRAWAAAGAVALLLLTFAAIAGVILILTRSLLQPWRMLMRSARAIGAGQTDTPTPCTDYSNEIGHVARILEDFRLAIAERTALTADLARERDVLDARVAARTTELDAARAAALESEELLSQALRSVSAGAWSFDCNRSGLWSSPQVNEICGKGFHIKDFRDGVWNLVCEPQASALRESPPDPMTGMRGLNEDLQIVRPDGEERWIRCTAVALPEGRMVGLVMDVTARKAQELELAEARRRAEHANSAKSRFIASMSHEIRTPLNGVLAMAAALERTPLGADQSRMVDVLLASGRQLLAMLDDVLDAAKIEAGRIVLLEEPFDLEANVEAVAALFRESARSKGLSLFVDVDRSAVGAWRGDALRVRQILQNFVSNAVKFTTSGAIRIRASSNGGALRLVVRDTGIGIAPEHAAQLFNHFVQADGSITRRYGGTGLGLAICRELADLMGGRVGVEAALGKGACFWFEVPLSRDIAAAEPRPEAARGLRILAAEDNPGNRAVLDMLLAQIGLTADFARNGVEAVECAGAVAYDLILMDIHMPAMDGVSAARAIRSGGAVNASTPIIALTASTEPEALAACRDAGMNGHVAKPIVPAALYAAIHSVMDDASETLAMPAAAR
jgi:signal transduction histidine kinase/AmiR/NasT family two-component response regulator